MSDNEAFARSGDRRFGDSLERINFEDALSLGEQTVQQPGIATGDADDERNGHSTRRF